MACKYPEQLCNFLTALAKQIARERDNYWGLGDDGWHCRCWRCKREIIRGDVSEESGYSPACSLCPRAFHRDCVPDAPAAGCEDGWMCSYCQRIGAQALG